MSLISTDGWNACSAIVHRTPNSRIVLVLDCPSLDDQKQNKPLQGTYGSVLSQAMSICRVTQSELSICYVFPDVTHTVGLWNEKTGFSVSGSEYLSRLKVFLEDLQPNVIIPLGECALQAITQKRGVTKWRGSILASTLVSSRSVSSETEGLLHVTGLTDGCKVVPSICPKSAVRMYLWRYFLINDLKRALEESFTADINLPKRTLVLQPSFLDAKTYLEFILREKPRVAHDIEVHKREVSCLSFAHSPTCAMCIPFTADWTEEEEITLWILVARILEDPEIEKVLQNGMFDISFHMARSRIITRGVIHDTMIKHNLNYPDFPKGLGFICSIATREPYYKDDGKTWFDDLRAGKGDIRQFYEYNAKDSAVLLEADPNISADLVKFGNEKTYEFNRRLMLPLLYMMKRGIKVDNEKLAAHRVEASAQRDEYQRQLDQLTREKWGKPLNVSSPKQCKEYFYDKLGYRPITLPKKDKDGQRTMSVSTSNKAMKKLAAKGCEEARLVQSIRAYRKLIGTYLNVTFDSDGRLRCSFNIAGTNSGRLSSSETIFGTGTNMQNLPKIFKGFLVADDGQLMCEMDKAQAEWVVVAYLCGDANMIATIENREDAHVNTAHLMFGAPKELIRREDELLGSLSDEDKIQEIRERDLPEILLYKPLRNMSCRQAGKKSNHGLNYDLGANGFAQTYGMSIDEAKRCYNLYHRAYPAIKIWHAHVRSQLSNDRTLVNLFGRRRRFLDRWCDDLFKAAYAYVPQSTVAQLLNYGLIKMYEEQTNDPYLALRQADLLLQVHDSVLFQYPKANVRGFAESVLAFKEFVEIPLKANGREFVIRTDAKIGYDAKNLEKINIEGSVEDVELSILSTTQKLDAKIAAKKLANEKYELVDLDDEDFYNDDEDE